MAATYEPIATQTLGSATGSVTFSSIPSTYTDLILIFNGGADGSGINICARFNSDTGTNYSTTRLMGNGTTATSDRVTSGSMIYGTVLSNATLNSNAIFQINNYSNTTTYKTCLIRTNATEVRLSATVSLWRNTAAISTIVLSPEFTGNFTSGSTFTLYGIKAA